MKGKKLGTTREWSFLEASSEVGAHVMVYEEPAANTKVLKSGAKC